MVLPKDLFRVEFLSEADSSLRYIHKLVQSCQGYEFLDELIKALEPMKLDEIKDENKLQ